MCKHCSRTLHVTQIITANLFFYYITTLYVFTWVLVFLTVLATIQRVSKAASTLKDCTINLKEAFGYVTQEWNVLV
jgi:hypothetical protein